MHSNNIYYLIPDIYSGKLSFKKLAKSVINLNTPSYLKSLKDEKKLSKNKAVGGIKIMLQHVMALQKHGFKAYPLKLGQFEGDVYGYGLEFLEYKDIRKKINAKDIVVSTEFSPYDGLLFPNAYKILFMQGWTFMKKNLSHQDKNKSYIDIGYDEVITCGDYNTEQVRSQMGITATTITNGIDQSKFYPDESKLIKNRVLCLSRKNYEDFLNIKHIVGEQVDFRVVDGLTQDELISEFQAADIFLATGYPEGLPLPPLEAMLCGCAVVGFTGGGASEYMKHNDTALVAEDGDCKAAATLLLELLSNQELRDRIRDSGRELALQYTLERMQSKVIDYYQSLTHKLWTAHLH